MCALKNRAQRADVIGQLIIKNAAGQRIPLEELAAIEEVVGPRQITRKTISALSPSRPTFATGTSVPSWPRPMPPLHSKWICRRAIFSNGAAVRTSTTGQQAPDDRGANYPGAGVPDAVRQLRITLRNALLIMLNIPLALVGGIVALG